MAVKALKEFEEVSCKYNEGQTLFSEKWELSIQYPIIN